MAKDATKREFLLRESAFKEIDSVTGYTALAVNIQTLLLTEKGTMPNDPNFGIGIRQYIHELLDDGLISVIKSAISSQMDMYLPNINVAEINLVNLSDQVVSGNITKALGIIITIEPPEGITKLEDLVSIGFNFSNTKKGTIISKVYL